MSFIVYKTTNLLNNKFYIGAHTSDNPDYLGSGDLLRKAIKKYGKHNFIRETLAELETIEEMYEVEGWFVDTEMIARKDCYNISLGGNRPPSHLGVKRSDATKLKLSNALIGKSKPPINHITRNKLSEAQKKLWNDETVRIERINSLTGKVRTEEHCKNISDSLKGRELSLEHKRKLSETKIGHIPWNKGIVGLPKRSEKSILKQKQSSKEFHESDEGIEFRKIMSDKMKGRTQEKKQCPHCKKCGGNTMGRWHFDNCKMKDII